MMEKDSYSCTSDIEQVEEYESIHYLYAVSMGTSETELVVYGTLEGVLKDYPDSKITHLGSAWRYCE